MVAAVRRSGGGTGAAPSATRSRNSAPRSRRAAGAGGSTSSPGGCRRARARTGRRRPVRALRSAARGRSGARRPRWRGGSRRRARESGSQSARRAPSGRHGRGCASGTTPASETSPRVGLIADVPERADGMRSEPAVSVPVAAGTIRAARAAAEPPLEPPAERSSAHGFPTWSVVPPIANSCVCRWPSRMAPSAESRAQPRCRRSGCPPGRGSIRSAACLDRVEVLQPDRDTAERLGAPPAASWLVRPGRGREGVLLVDPHPGVDRAGIAVVGVGCRPARGSAPGDASTSSREESVTARRASDARRLRGRLGRSPLDHLTSDVGTRTSPCYTRLRMAHRTTPPFRADHVGSLLRPPALLQARRTTPPGASTATGYVRSRTRRSARP